MLESGLFLDQRFNISLNGTALLLRPINIMNSALLGEQLGVYTETYDYDEATVMQPYYNSIIEDGWGIHASDAYLIRRIYDDQRGINGAIRDVGVESYYGSNGLNNSTTDGFFYTPGQSITLNNVLVENMTYAAVSDLRIRFFLSSNNIISTADYEMDRTGTGPLFARSAASIQLHHDVHRTFRPELLCRRYFDDRRL